MKKERFFAVRQLAGRKMERVQAEGYRVERGRFAFYICGSGGSWGVTEAKSGMLIGVYGKTRKECIEKLQAFDLSRLEKFDLEKMNKEMLSLPLCGLREGVFFFLAVNRSSEIKRRLIGANIGRKCILKMFSVFGIIKMIKISQWIKVRNGTALCGAFFFAKNRAKNFLKAEPQKPTKKAKYSQKDKKYCKKIVSVI